MLNFLENIKMALDNIRANKMRSLLTMLGIIIGISSVITIVSLGDGGKNSITGEFDKIGASTVTLSVKGDKAEKSDYITFDDIDKIKEKVDTVKYVTPAVQKNGEISSDKKKRKAMIIGGNEQIISIRNLEIISGRFMSERDCREGRAVVVIDEGAAKSLFGQSDVVGKTVKLGAGSSPKKATVIGVTKNVMGAFSNVDDDKVPVAVYTPATFLKTLNSTDFAIDNIIISAVTKEDSEAAGNGAKNIIESRHHNKGKDFYKADSLMKQLDQINAVLGIFTSFIGGVAGISLMVGGIGVMNIMLVSVTERTREIGIRKAIGATTRTIMMQFLTESVIISLIGGIIGMVVGIVGSNLLGLAVKITPSISVSVVVGVLLFSSAVGIFFGIYPARKAAKLDPMEALRYE